MTVLEAPAEIMTAPPGGDMAPSSTESGNSDSQTSQASDQTPGDSQAGDNKPASAQSDKKSPKQNGKIELSRPASEIYTEAERKLTENPEYQLTQEEIEAFEQTRDEKLGKKKPNQPSNEKPEASKPAPHNNPAIQKAMEYVGAKSVEELPAKVEALRKEFDRVNGERGKMPQLNQLQNNVRGQHNLIADMLAGKPEAYAFAAKAHGLDPSKIQGYRNGNGQTPNSAPSGGKFDTYLDPEVAIHMEAVDKQLREVEVMKQFMQGEMDKRTLDDARVQTLNEMSDIIQQAPELFDSKKHGSLRTQMDQYWNTKKDSPIPESVKRIIEVMQLAADHGFNSLKPAYEIWAYRNRGSVQSEAIRSATHALTGKRASVGLSDQQQGRTGTGYSQAEVQKMADGEADMPQDWVDQRTGRLLVDKMPAEVRNVLLATRRS